VLEIETSAVGGEEDDVVGEDSAKLYTTPADTLGCAAVESDWRSYLLAATFRYAWRL
jgi:fructose/tagatose bisphosphate aldolase